jgi:hypothetical protein
VLSGSEARIETTPKQNNSVTKTLLQFVGFDTAETNAAYSTNVVFIK